MAVDLSQLLARERRCLRGVQAVVQLRDRAGADQRRRHARVAKHPRQRHLRERLAAPLGDGVQRADAAEVAIVQELGFERAAEPGPRPLRHAAEVLVGQQPLRQRREGNAADPEFAERVEQPLLHPAVEHRIGRLVDQQRRAQRFQDRHRLPRQLRRIRGDADIQRFALPHRAVQCSHRFLQRRARIDAVRVEDVHVVQAHAFQALVEAGGHRFAAAPFTVRAVPHLVAGLGGDHDLVAIRLEVAGEHAAEVLLRRAEGRAVVVGEVEMRDAAVERATQDAAAGLEHVGAAKVLPEPKRDGRQVEAGAAAAPIRHRAVAVSGGPIRGVEHSRLHWRPGRGASPVRWARCPACQPARSRSAIRQTISNITTMAFIAVIWFGESLVGIRHTTSPPTMLQPRRPCSMRTASPTRMPV